MTGPDTAANAMIAGSVLSFAGVVFTVWWSSNANERRDASVARRQADQDAKHDLEMCEITCDRLREERAALLADLAYHKGQLDAAHKMLAHPDRNTT